MRDTVMATLIAAALLAGLAAPASAAGSEEADGQREGDRRHPRPGGRPLRDLRRARGPRAARRLPGQGHPDWRHLHRTVHLQRRPWLVLGHERGHDLGRRGRGDRVTDSDRHRRHRGCARATGTLTETGTTDLTTAFVREEVTGSLTVRPEKRPATRSAKSHPYRATVTGAIADLQDNVALVVGETRGLTAKPGFLIISAPQVPRRRWR